MLLTWLPPGNVRVPLRRWLWATAIGRCIFHAIANKLKLLLVEAPGVRNYALFSELLRLNRDANAPVEPLSAGNGNAIEPSDFIPNELT
jgi:hypothetical protein